MMGGKLHTRPYCLVDDEARWSLRVCLRASTRAFVRLAQLRPSAIAPLSARTAQGGRSEFGLASELGLARLGPARALGLALCCGESRLHTYCMFLCFA